MCVVLSQIFSPDKKPLWWVLPCWVCGSQCVWKDRNHPSMLLKFSKKSWERTKSSLGPLRTQTKKGTKEKESFKFKGFQVFYDSSGHNRTLIWGVQALQFSGKGKRYVVGLKPSLLGPTILVNLQAVWKECNVPDQWWMRLKLLGIVWFSPRLHPKPMPSKTMPWMNYFVKSVS